MQGNEGQGGDPWDRNAGRRAASLNGTGKHHSVPQRPSGTQRVERPATPRVPRPTREKASPRNTRRTFLIMGAVFLACTLLACVLGGVVFNYINGLSASSGAAVAAADFLGAISGPTPNYHQAFQDLGSNITLSQSEDTITRQFQAQDKCLGLVTNYVVVPNSATAQGASQSYTYNITRSKLQKPYQLTLTLEFDKDKNAWKVTQYADNLPDQATCK